MNLGRLEYFLWHVIYCISSDQKLMYLVLLYWVVVLCHPILMVSVWPSLKIITFDDESVKKVIFFFAFHIPAMYKTIVMTIIFPYFWTNSDHSTTHFNSDMVNSLMVSN